MHRVTNESQATNYTQFVRLKVDPNVMPNLYAFQDILKNAGKQMVSGPIDFHCVDENDYESQCLVINILQNEKTHTGLEWQNCYFWVDSSFNLTNCTFTFY